MRFSRAYFSKFSLINFQEGDINKYIEGLKTSDRARPGFVSIYGPDYYKKNRVFTSPDGQQGFALLNHGDGRVEIAGVYNNDPNAKGAAKEAVRLGFSLGGNYLEAFEADPSMGESQFSLPHYYNKLVGAQPTQYLPFDPQYAHPNWDYKTYGKPGIVSLQVPENAHDDPNKWLETKHDNHLFHRNLLDLKERTLNPQKKQAKKSKNVVALYDMPVDPIEAYENWEQKTNIKRAKRDASKGKKK